MADATPPHGYVADVQLEKNESFYEIFLFQEPPPKVTPLRDVIFNPELSREFREKYRDKFGSVDTDSLNYTRTDYDRLDLNKAYLRDVETQNDERRSFADYMIKRLFEWHLDNYVKSEPAMRPVYEAKQKLQKIEVKVNKETKLDMKYSLAGNTFDIDVINPYLDSRLMIQMDPGSIGPAPIQEEKLVLGKPLTTSLRVENTTYDHEGRSRLALIKTHRNRITTNYEISAAYKGGGNTPRDSRVAWGLGYSF